MEPMDKTCFPYGEHRENQWGAELTISSSDELEGILRAGRVVGSALRTMRKVVRPGMTTQALDDICADVFERHGARSGPQLVYRGL